MTQAIPRHPLTWPEGWRRTSGRTRGKFLNRGSRLQTGAAVQRVLDELRRLGISDADAVISTNLRLRLDGLPRADQGEPMDPGVAVYWQDRQGRMKVMAATLEAMRAIERHGGGEILERSFTGFDALPPPRNPFDYLGVSPAATEASVQVAYKAKLRTHHPDSGGSHNLMADLNWARDEALKLIRQRNA